MTNAELDELDPRLHPHPVGCVEARLLASNIPRLIDAVRAAREEADEVARAWKEASGLTIGGDPGDVEPDHLNRYNVVIGEVIRLARSVVVGRHHVSGSPHAELLGALAELDAKWPEE